MMKKQIAPYKLVATIAEDGLGLTRWWEPAESMEEGNEDQVISVK